MMNSMLRTALAVAGALATSAAFAQTVNWKLNNNFAPVRNETKQLHSFASDVEARSKGRMKVTVHDGGSLQLKDADIMRWLPTGAAEIGVLSASFVGRDAPEINAAYIQGSVGSSAEHMKALPALENIYRDAVKQWHMVPVGFMAFPVFRTHIFCRDDDVNTLAALRKKKVRVWSKDLVDTFGRLGVATQIIPQNELYVALRTGVVDCSLYPARLAGSISIQEVTKGAAYLFPVAAMPYVLVVDENKWKTLPGELQKAMTDAAAKLYETTKRGEDDEAAEKAAQEKLAAGGVKFLPDFPEADRKAFLEAAAKTWDELAKAAGPKAVSYRAEVLKTLGR
jgi:TRAP-type C4-dicarboxylate transport system substrate-binding protein